MKTKLLLILILCISINVSYSQKRVYNTKQIESKSPIIDGYLNDDVWKIVEWSNNFTQRIPNDGDKASQKTSFKVIYDNDYLYIAVRAYDTEVEKIERTMTRRDGFAGDLIEINIDSYFDKRTGFSFSASASGVKGDELISNDGNNWDKNWNPVWYLKTSIDDKGWIVEIKIPFNQLRFGKKEEQIWGIQVQRYLFRKSEKSYWEHISQDKSGWVSHFGELHGIKGIKPKRQISLTPYASAKFEFLESEDKNPYQTGQKRSFNAGIDGKIGITNDLTLDFSINPDFGQVEADPSELNLSGFETFFSEKRPFFIEGNNITDFRITGGGSSYSRDNLFYSRRIGRSPRFEPELNDNEYVDMPENTPILGAFKLTGKTKNGLSIGILESFTKAKAEIDNNGDKRKVVVSPFTNYFIGRLQQDFNKANTIAGIMFTATNRDISDPDFYFLNRDAYTGGIDFTKYWKNKKYYLKLNTVFSHISGDSVAITDAQTSHKRYFQRTDASHLSIDSSLTSLAGYGGNFSIGKSSNSKLRYTFSVAWRSPGLELNDVGYVRKSDAIFQYSWMGYRVTKPFSIFRNFNINLNQWSGWDFNSVNTFSGYNVNSYSQFKNLWGFFWGAEIEGENVSNSELRGGPSLVLPEGTGAWFGFHTDQRKKLNIFSGGSFGKGFDESSKRKRVWMDVNYRPLNSLQITISPHYSISDNKLQYIETVDYNKEKRYIFSSIDRKTFAVTSRIDYSITPELTIQYFGQIYISAGNYYDIKRITDSKASNFDDRYHVFTDGKDITYNSDDDEYNIDENLDAINDYSFDSPDFNFKEFKSNFVVRWEYKPGSTIYLVWSQGRSDYDETKGGRFSFNNDFNKLYKVIPHDIFLIKLSYRIGL